MRIRQTGDSVLLTFKGPRLESAVKTREEIELALTQDPAAQTTALALFQRLGFRMAGQVVKHRETFAFHHDAIQVLVCLDRVEDLGNFVEVETLSNAEDLDGARQTIVEFCRILGLDEPVKKSYLTMVLALRPQR